MSDSRLPLLVFAALATVALAPRAAAQHVASLAKPTLIPPVATATAAVALRVSTPPVLDGRDDDPVWKEAQIINAFREFTPKEDGDPSFRTEARVVYDDRNLYVLVRAYDAHPDSIVGLLSRRDVRTQSDQLKVMIDSYHDRRTGYEFAVNPVGVKRDYYTFNDSEEDESWDAVWDAATSIDSLGWVAEFRIPFSQLRFPKSPELTFGIGIWRDIARSGERDSWPVYRYSRPGISSQLGDLSGIRVPTSVARLELMPYVVTKNVTQQENTGWNHPQQITGGADLKYGVTSNLTLNATINPDFGQVEADPAVVNLSGFETFFPEKRPFFIEGMGTFRFDLACNNGQCSGLFYSRRIGREPELGDGDPSTPLQTTILGAAKLTGRTPGGLSLGVLDAVTSRESGAIGQTVEPRSNYGVARVQQDFRQGQSSVGAMLTAVDRQLDDDSTRFYLRRSAYTGGVDFRHQFGGRDWQVNGFVAASRVDGSDSAIALLQRSNTHLFQRPNDGATYDPTRTSLSGTAEKISFGKIGGGITRFNTTYARYSPGFDANDVGFLRAAGTQSWSNWAGLQYNTAHSFYNQLFLNWNEWTNWSTAALSGAHLTDFGMNVNASAQLHNTAFVNAGVDLNRFLPVYDNQVTRGGPALRRVPFYDGWLNYQGDQRLRVSPSLNLSGFRGIGNSSFGWSVDPQLTVRVTSALMLTLGPHYDHNTDDNQWVANVPRTQTLPGGGTMTDTAFTFGHINQNTASLTTRVDYTIKPTLSVQLYAAPFVSSARYTNWRELRDPRAANYADRFQPYTDSLGVSQYNFDIAQFNSNFVIRWEYRPGSTLYVVWSQGRNFEHDGAAFGGTALPRSARDLFFQHPNDILLVKMSYWLNP